VAKAYSEFFFAYNDGPLLIVDASEIDFVGNVDDRSALLEVISQTRAGVNHWSRR
jgi:deoxyadenosine/deoxycytidine kinase